MVGRDQVHVYDVKADARAPEAIARDFAVLEPGERERAGRFRFDSDRRAYVAAHALLRRALSHHAPVEPADWRFSADPGERPEILAPARAPRLRFSLSHTRSVVACAIVPELDVGFDVEDLAREAPLEVAERFAPFERAALAALGPGPREDRFFAYWTLKEAYMKARGLGLAIGLDQIAFDVSLAKITISFGPGCPDDAAAWRFASFRIGDACRAALAVRTGRELEIVRSTA
jgi:4'-phosphopantetheinyl transferase